MVSFRQSKKVKSVHGNINPRSLKDLSKIKGIKKIVPGQINWRKKTSRVSAGLYFQRISDNSLKMCIKGNMYVQDVYVMLEPDFKLSHLRSIVLNPEKIPREE